MKPRTGREILRASVWKAEDIFGHWFEVAGRFGLAGNTGDDRVSLTRGLLFVAVLLAMVMTPMAAGIAAGQHVEAAGVTDVEAVRALVSPTAMAEADKTTVDVGESVEFDGTNSFDEDGTIEEYYWDLDGDGEFEASGEIVTHAFDSPGDHTVVLVVVDDDGNRDSDSVTVTVEENAPPTADARASESTAMVGESIQFDGTNSSDRDGTIEGYQWDFDGDGAIDATGGTVTQAFESAGDYDVALTVTDDDGATDQDTVTVTVQRKRVQLNLSANTTTIQPGEIIQFELQRQDNHTPVNGMLIINGETYSTKSDGRVALSIDSSRDFDAIGTKEQTRKTTFVNDSLSVTISNGSSGPTNTPKNYSRTTEAEPTVAKTGSATASPSSTPSTASNPTTSPGQHGFGVVVALVGLTAGLLWRHQD